ncbi:MAG TPA: hypothetical protein PLU39_00080 [Armatimonadota bacterium]|jgi:hypothetical protein|nr:hypothetical protein [Armatimonadota bacterium]HOM80700.1 hypothetical protein [Armatimonadota bacterium]HPO73046.1 hypothetical protein [Armatimonadota bacterium]HPT96244.1 hypothetical protein [Armatimonadota bacterium]
MKLSRREIAMVALCVVVVAFIGVPSLKQMQPVESRTPEALAADAGRVRARCAALEQEIASLEKEVRSLSWSEEPSRLPTRILTELDLVAEKAGVTLATLRPGRPVAVASGSKLPFTVQVRAPFPKAIRFLRRLQQTQDRVALERLQVVSTDASTDIVSLELRLAVYSSVPPESK